MPATRKHLLGGVAVCAGITLSAFSVAWACTPGGGINVNPGSGAAGSSALVSGSGYEATGEAAGAGATAGPVEIRWNSMSGTVLATASGPSFSTSVTIPASAGERTRNRTYYIVAVQKLASGQLRTASAPFTVPATEPETETQAAPQPEAQPQPVAQEAPAPAPAPAGNEAVAAPSAATGAPAAAKAAPARRTSGRVGPATARTAPATAGSNTSSASAAPASQTPEPAPAPAEVAQLPSGRTLSSDVWSGFSEGATSRGPSLVDPTSSTNGSGDAGLGLGLVALGTVGLLGGTVVAVRSRRRLVPVEASAETE